ncbi:MAG: glucoamylase family protein [Bryobacteraceae bacterium]
MGESKENRERISRRVLLRTLAGSAAMTGLGSAAGLQSAPPAGKAAAKPAETPAKANQPPPVTPPPVMETISPQDDQFLDEIEKANFQFFLEQADPDTGLVKDRAKVQGADTSIVASIAATGFGLTALAIGSQRGYIDVKDAHQRVLKALQFLGEKMPTHRGFFFHFANVKTGQREWDSEASSIDTAILLCGIVTCREYFQFKDVAKLAGNILDRVDWKWLSEDTTLLPLGWTPERGFLPSRWNDYSELMMLYLLGLGAKTKPLSAAAWGAWKRTVFNYQGLQYIGSFAPLFVHQYSQAWFDFRQKRDKYADYFLNSILATEAHRLFCIELGSQFPDYNDSLWGITASDSKNGYVIWGGPPKMGPIDGTVVPCAAAGSLPYLPQATLRVLHTIKDRFGKQAWTRYGFVDAFNPLSNWYDTDVIGIDTGITMLMAENLRTGFVWNTFMKSEEAKRGLQRAGFQSSNISYLAEQTKLEARSQ